MTKQKLWLCLIIGEKILKNLLKGQTFALEASLFRQHDELAVLVGLYYEFPVICLKCSVLKREDHSFHWNLLLLLLLF